MLLCTEVIKLNGDLQVGVLDTDDFKFERFMYSNLLPYIESGMSVYGTDFSDSRNYYKVQIGLLKFMESQNGYVEREDLIIIMPKIEMERDIRVRDMHVWFKGYYYKFQYKRENIHERFLINGNMFFENSYPNQDIRNIYISEDSTLCIELFSSTRGWLYGYTDIFLHNGNIIYEGKRKRNFKGIPMSKELFKRSLINGGIRC